MDAEERLSLEEVQEPTLLSAHHLHRYHLAAAMCQGLRVLDLACGVGYGSALIRKGGAASVHGVDRDDEAIARADQAFAEDGTTFATGDAIDTLRSIGPDEVDAIVAFEALEHLDRLEEALELLEERAGEGIRLLLSVPNSRMFKEKNEFHLSDFDYDSAVTAFDRFDGVELLHQHIAEGSIICGSGTEFQGRVEALDRAEPEYSNTLMAAVGFDAERVGAATAQLNVVVTPNHNRYMVELEAANAELRAANLRLTRDWMGRSDAAAASVLARHERERRAVERENEELRHQLVVRGIELERALESARANDLLAQRERAWRDAPRYHAVDAVRDRILAVPLLAPLLRFLWRRVMRR